MKTPRTWSIRSVAAFTTVGSVSGACISVIVDRALFEISLTPFFAGVSGFVLLLLGSLMLWRKLWESYETPCMRFLVQSCSSLVLLSGVVCFLLEKHTFATIPPSTKVPLYALLSTSLCFSVSFTAIELLNARHDPSSYDDMRRRRVSTPQQLSIVLGAMGMGASFGLIFGAMDVEDAVGSTPAFRRWRSHEKLRTEESASLPVGVLIGGIVGGVNAMLAHRADAALLGEHSEGLLDEHD